MRSLACKLAGAELKYYQVIFLASITISHIYWYTPVYMQRPKDYNPGKNAWGTCIVKL